MLVRKYASLIAGVYPEIISCPYSAKPFFDWDIKIKHSFPGFEPRYLSCKPRALPQHHNQSENIKKDFYTLHRENNQALKIIFLSHLRVRILENPFLVHLYDTKGT